MKVVKVTVGKSDKFSVPGAYESTGTSLSVEVGVEDGEQLNEVVARAKAELEPLYWWLAIQDYNEALKRAKITTPNYMLEKGTSYG